jgi:hypothetical protein
MKLLRIILLPLLVIIVIIGFVFQVLFIDEEN